MLLARTCIVDERRRLEERRASMDPRERPAFCRGPWLLASGPCARRVVRSPDPEADRRQAGRGRSGRAAHRRQRRGACHAAAAGVAPEAAAGARRAPRGLQRARFGEARALPVHFLQGQSHRTRTVRARERKRPVQLESSGGGTLPVGSREVLGRALASGASKLLVRDPILSRLDPVLLTRPEPAERARSSRLFVRSLPSDLASAACGTGWGSAMARPGDGR